MYEPYLTELDVFVCPRLYSTISKLVRASASFSFVTLAMTCASRSKFSGAFASVWNLAPLDVARFRKSQREILYVFGIADRGIEDSI